MVWAMRHDVAVTTLIVRGYLVQGLRCVAGLSWLSQLGRDARSLI